MGTHLLKKKNCTSVVCSALRNYPKNPQCCSSKMTLLTSLELFVNVLVHILQSVVGKLLFKNRHTHMGKTEPTENGDFFLFAANGKRKRQNSICLPANGNGKLKFVSPGRLTTNGNRRFPSWQTCPSMQIGEEHLLETKKLRRTVLIMSKYRGQEQRWAPTTTLRALNIFSETLYEE